MERECSGCTATVKVMQRVRAFLCRDSVKMDTSLCLSVCLLLNACDVVWRPKSNFFLALACFDCVSPLLEIES